MFWRHCLYLCHGAFRVPLASITIWRRARVLAKCMWTTVCAPGSGWVESFVFQVTRSAQTQTLFHMKAVGFVKDHFTIGLTCAWTIWIPVCLPLFSVTSVFSYLFLFIWEIILYQVMYLACHSSRQRQEKSMDKIDFTQGDYRLALFYCWNPSKHVYALIA